MDKRKFYLIVIITTILFCWTTLLVWQGYDLSKKHSAHYNRGSRMNDHILENDRSVAKQNLTNAIYYQTWLNEGRTDLIKESLNAQIATNIISLASFSTYQPTPSQVEALKQSHPEEYKIIHDAFMGRNPNQNVNPFQLQIDTAFYTYLQQTAAEEARSKRFSEIIREKIDTPPTE